MRHSVLSLSASAILAVSILLMPEHIASAQQTVDGSSGSAIDLGASAYVQTSGAQAAIAPSSAESALLALTNNDRAQNGLPALQLDAATLDIARQRAADQSGLANLSHTNAQGQLVFAQMIQAENLPYRLIGENLARVSGVDASVPSIAETALMNSPTHRANILDASFDLVSIGSVVDYQGRTVFAEIYRADR